MLRSDLSLYNQKYQNILDNGCINQTSLSIIQGQLGVNSRQLQIRT